MNNFVFENRTRFYFGQGQLDALAAELADAKVVMLAYGGGSLKRTGVYDRIVEPLKAVGKRIVDFPGIMANPTIAKVMEGAALAKAEGVDYVLAVGGGSVMDCSKYVCVAAVEDLDEDEFWAKYYQRFEPIACLPTGFKALGRDELRAILRESL